MVHRFGAKLPGKTLSKEPGTEVQVAERRYDPLIGKLFLSVELVRPLSVIIDRDRGFTGPHAIRYVHYCVLGLGYNVLVILARTTKASLYTHIP